MRVEYASRSCQMRRIGWALIFLTATLFMLSVFWVAASSHWNLEDQPAASRIVIGFWIFACVGPYWMLYNWFIRRGKKKWKSWLWLFFVPLGFLWYYFEEYRPSRRTGLV
jgi:hypothetical protein